MRMRSPNAVLAWFGAAAVIGIAVVAFQRNREHQHHAEITANVRHQIATLWHPDPAMPFARIQSVTLAQTQADTYAGEVVYTFGKYEKKLPLFVTWQDGKLQWAIDAPNRLPMKVETIITSQLYYEHPVTDDQAGKLAGWMVAEEHIGQEEGSMFLRKEG